MHVEVVGLVEQRGILPLTRSAANGDGTSVRTDSGPRLEVARVPNRILTSSIVPKARRRIFPRHFRTL